MTHVSCPGCRLRFAQALAVHLAECPLCGGPLDRSIVAEPMLGYWLFDANSAEPQGTAHGSSMSAGDTGSARRPLVPAIGVSGKA